MLFKELCALLQEMSPEEKIGELFQIPPAYYENGNVTGPAAELGITQQDLQLAGSCLSVIGAEKLRRLQQEHIANHPHHIPMLFMADIINGYRTVFPIPLAQGCTFDPALVEAGAAIAAREAAASGIHVTFSPMADLCWDARWGRVMESTGEDPYLNGEMAAAMVRGYQGPDNVLTEKGRIAACLKHFAAYGAPEGGRDYNTVELSERTLRQDYLYAYQKAVAAGCAMVMTSFNTLDRIPSSANRRLMRDILRGEMNFSGVLISDWAALLELTVHGIAADPAEAARLGMEAGVDIDMATTVYLKNLKSLLASGAVSQSLVDECVLRILILKNELGLFENPYKDADENDEKKLLLRSEHRQAARECAEQSFVLLKNEDYVLPLKQEETVAFIGPYVDNRLVSGSWSFFSDDADCVSLREGVQGNFPQSSVLFAPGCGTVDPGVEVIGFQKAPPRESIDTPDKLENSIREAVLLAQRADKVVLALGEPRDYSGESASRANLELPDCQLELLRRVAAVNPAVCVVLFNGRPLDLRKVEKYAKGILEVWFPGTESGNAIARVLYGESNPCGKLAMSFPYCVGQVPVHYNHMRTGRPLQGDYRKQRFTSQYLDIPNEPLYPFGYGLSYTSFSCSPITLDKSAMKRDESLPVRVCVTNTGDRAGQTVVQLYLHDVSASVTRPVKELKGFQKIALAPGESEELTFFITEEMLRFYDAKMQFVSEPGEFEVFVGFDSTTENKSSFVLVE